jgi:hypothetical protein
VAVGRGVALGAQGVEPRRLGPAVSRASPGRSVRAAPRSKISSLWLATTAPPGLSGRTLKGRPSASISGTPRGPSLE